MRRLVWMGVGAVGAAVVAARVRRAARRFTPDGVAEQVEAVGRRTTSALREAVEEFRTARTAREHELVTALLVEPAAGPAPRSSRRAGSVEDLEDEDDFF